MTLSIVMVTNNAKDVMEGALESVVGLWEELLVGDGGSTDGTAEIVKKYGATMVAQKAGMALGERKQKLVARAKGEWILVLDADERVGEELRKEIGRLGDRKIGRKYVAYRIPYQNYVFGRPVYYGGERYSKVRLFRRGYGSVSPEPLHEEVIIQEKLHKGLKDGFIGELHGVIHHHSYRTPWQLFAKFTRYAWIGAGMQRSRNDIVRKLFLYGPHMFWARYVEEKGYKDGWRGLLLALAFGYMETLTYWLVLLRKP